MLFGSPPGDEMFSDSYGMREVQDGFFYEVDGKVSCASESAGKGLSAASVAAQTVYRWCFRFARTLWLGLW